MNRVTYDAKNNVPNVLIKNLARTLGWKTPSAIEKEGLIESVFSDNTSLYAGVSQSKTPSELDSELYRRLLLNTANLFKSKGSRKSIEFMLRFVGAPEALIEFHEHVYVAGAKLNMKDFDRKMSLMSGGTYTVEEPIFDPNITYTMGSFPSVVN